MQNSPYIAEFAGRVFIRVYLQPRASKNGIAGLHGDELKVTVTAPPVDNAANEMVIRLLAGLLGVSRSSVTVKSGQTSRHKTIAVAGKSLGEVRTLLGF